MSIRIRRGTAASAAANNPILADGEIAIETDTGVLKVGDGATAWTGLPPVLDSTFVRKGTLVVNVKDYGAKGDGTTDDTAAIHSARDAAGVGGGVYLPPGTYITTGLALNVASQAWRLAEGATIKAAAGIAASVVTVTGSGVALTGGIVDGNRAAQTGTGQIGVTLAAAGVIMRGVEVTACRDSGIAVTSGASGCLVEGNHSHDNGYDGNAAAGIYINGSPANRIIGNYCHGNGTYGFGGTYDGDGIKVQDGTGAEGGTLNLIAGNVCRHNARRGIKAQQAFAVITGNLCEDNGVAGIGVNNSSAPDTGASMTISGNVLPSNYRGLHLDNCADIAISGNLIINSADIGLLANTSCVRITVVGNVIRKSARHGAYISGLKDSTITGNTFSSNGTGGVDRYGLALVDDTGAIKCERVLVSGNVSENAGADTSQTHGFVIAGTADRIHLVGNRAENGLTVAFSLGGSVTNISRFGNKSSAISEAGAQFSSFYMSPGSVIDGDTGTGFKIGSDAARKVGFYGAAPVVRPSGTPAAATDAATTQALANDLRAKLLALGLIG